MKFDIRSLWLSYTKSKWERKMLIAVAVISAIPVLASALMSSAPHDNDAPKAALASVDTYIPRGFVLVPIEVENYEALDSILGRFGIVDLMKTNLDGKSRQAIVASNIRILRAPQNPSHFAVLVPESEATRLLAEGSAFTVIVKRRQSGGTKFVMSEAKPAAPKRRIVYEGE